MARRRLNLDAVQEADVVDLTHDGRGVARVDGKAVFIDGALPGERVRFRVHRQRRSVDEAGLVDVLVPSADRVTPRCAHFGVCGGCSLQHMAPAAQLAAKQRQLLDNLQRIGKVEPARVYAPMVGPEWAYRRRARLGTKFVYKKGRVLAGFREREKPYLADVRRCEILVERFATLPQDVAALLETLDLKQDIPQVEVSVGDTAAALVFRVMQPVGPDDAVKLEAFGTRLDAQIFLQTGGHDSVRPLRADYPPLEYAVDSGRVAIEFGPIDFIQINRDINVSIVAAAMQLLDPTADDLVLDLFSGLGNFTLPLARRARHVVGVEGDAGLVEKARANARRNGLDNVSFHSANLFEPAQFDSWAKSRYDLVLLDPPRAGAAQVIERMSHLCPRRVVYISCHPGSLARDAGILVDNLGFRLVGAGVMDMFPHTTHVESIAVFEQDA